MALTRNEINNRADEIRQLMLAILNEDGRSSLRHLAGKLKLSYSAARAYSKHLVSCGAAEKDKVKLETYFTSTGVPYSSMRKPIIEKVPVSVQELSNPNLRVIKLLDRTPLQISKAEHDAARRSSTKSLRGSSMAMFDLF